MENFLSDEPRGVPGYQNSREFYSDEFINALAKDFEFEPPNIELLTKIYEVPYRYKLANRLYESDREYQPEHRKNLQKLQKKFRAFLEELEEQGGEYFNLEVSGGARMAKQGQQTPMKRTTNRKPTVRLLSLRKDNEGRGVNSRAH